MVLILLSSLLAVACTSVAQKNDLPVAQFKDGIAKPDIQILDVRTQGEYNSGHLKGAFLADWTQPKVFEERVKSLDKNKPVYTYCLSGGRSSAAAAKLRQEGFKEVYNMEGGMMAWKGAQMPVEGIGAVNPITMGEYFSKIPSNKTVLVDIGAVWCPPCKKMEPVIRDLVQGKKADFVLVYIDGGTQEKLATDLDADAFPTFIIYKNGKETWRQSGVVSKEVLLKQLQ
jgi:rhodanese-related sulfurtransferase